VDVIVLFLQLRPLCPGGPSQNVNSWRPESFLNNTERCELPVCEHQYHGRVLLLSSSPFRVKGLRSAGYIYVASEPDHHMFAITANIRHHSHLLILLCESAPVDAYLIDAPERRRQVGLNFSIVNYADYVLSSLCILP
jgi:hypothetical protein